MGSRFVKAVNWIDGAWSPANPGREFSTCIRVGTNNGGIWRPFPIGQNPGGLGELWANGTEVPDDQEDWVVITFMQIPALQSGDVVRWSMWWRTLVAAAVSNMGFIYTSAQGSGGPVDWMNPNPPSYRPDTLDFSVAGDDQYGLDDYEVDTIPAKVGEWVHLSVETILHPTRGRARIWRNGVVVAESGDIPMSTKIGKTWLNLGLGPNSCWTASRQQVGPIRISVNEPLLPEDHHGSRLGPQLISPGGRCMVPRRLMNKAG